MTRLLILILLVFPILSACSGSEKSEVIAVAKQYWLAWQEGDEELMASVLHDRLAKRAILEIPDDGKLPPEQRNIWQEEGYYLHDQGKLILVNNTRKKKPRRKNYRNPDIQLLDQRGNAAIVKISTNRMVDYLQLVKVKQRWYIINVLWTLGS